MKDFTQELEAARQELEKVQEKLAGEAGTEEEKNTNTRVKEKDGVTYVELLNGDIVELRLGEITGNTIVKAKNKVKEIRKKNDIIVVEELDDYYYLYVAEAIGNKKASYLLSLKFKDYNLVKNVVRNFLSED